MAKGHKTGGRQKGTPNKTTALLKDAVIEAARKAGEKVDPETRDGLVSYLTHQAGENPQSFIPLLGKVLPMQVAPPDEGEGEIVIRWKSS